MLTTGMRITCKEEIDLRPHTTIKKGETGTIVHTTSDALGVYAVDVHMDCYHKGLVEWNNEAHIMAPEVGALNGLITRRLETVAPAVLLIGDERRRA
jgi:hypothetical protein